MKISFIGSGKMAEALISGITESHTLSANSINCTDRDDNKTTYLNKKYKINKYTNNLDAIKNANIIFICIKPQDINILSNELKDQFYDRFRLGMIMKKDYDYIFKRLDEITDYLINQSGYEE